MFNRKEVVVRVKGMLGIGFLSMIAATAPTNASGSFAADTNPADPINRIGHGGSTYQSKSAKIVDCRVDVAARIGHGGSTYSSSQSGSVNCALEKDAGKPVNVMARIGHGGSTYSFTQLHSSVRTMRN